MTQNCELCGRGTAQKALTPFWYPHDTLCDRSGCRHAARDAVMAIFAAREEFGGLAADIAERKGGKYAQGVSVGWRGDAHAKIDVVENRDWWGNKALKSI